jgi:hypothetical protein
MIPFFFLMTGSANGQNITVVKKATLINTIQESSGLLNYNGRIITHNDSGGDAELYEIDSVTGNVIRTVGISNAKNNDWEDLAQDNLYIYIGDFGNNSGTRHNLKIYRISKNDYLNTTTGTVEADSILFSYADQTSFAAATYTTNYDAEAMIIRNDSVYIFTKNWGNFKTHIYSLPKSPGIYQAHRIDSLNVQGLITGATYSLLDDTILLSGYSFTGPFIWRCTQFNSGRLSAGSNEKFILSLASDIQTEGICRSNSFGYFVSSETKGTTAASLYFLEMPSIVTGTSAKYKKVSYALYPNPGHLLNIQSDKAISIDIIDLNGKVVFNTNKTIFDVSVLKVGHYVVRIKDNEGNIIGHERLIID